MALTLTEAAKLATTPLQKGVIEVFARTSPVLEYMPFMNVSSNSYKYNQEDTLPGIGFRAIGADYTEGTGVLNPVTETLTILGGHSDVDRVLVKTQGNINDIRATHDAMKAKAAALEFTRCFIKGDDSSDDEFDGLQTRLTGDQKIAAGSTADGDDLTLDMLDELIDQTVGDGSVSRLLLMNKKMRRKVNKLMRAAGSAFELINDSFGRQIPAYGGIPIGVLEDDSTGSAILDFDEVDGAGNGTACTSIYCVAFGAGEYVSGLQCGEMDVIDHGLYSGGVAYRTTIEWITGMSVFHPKAAARLFGIKEPS